MIPDSPRWLLKMGRSEEAKRVLLDGFQYNGGKDIPHDLDERLKPSDKSDLIVAPSWWSIWTGTKAKRSVILVHFAWAVYVTNFNGMLLNVKAFGRDLLSIHTIVFGNNQNFIIIVT